MTVGVAFPLVSGLSKAGVSKQMFLLLGHRKVRNSSEDLLSPHTNTKWGVGSQDLPQVG